MCMDLNEQEEVEIKSAMNHSMRNHVIKPYWVQKMCAKKNSSKT